VDDNLDIVKEILELRFKTGVSSKTGKEWAIHRILTNSGKTCNTFDDVEPGDTVKLTYNDEYKSWNATKPRKADNQHDEIMKALRELYKLLKEITDARTHEI